LRYGMDDYGAAVRAKTGRGSTAETAWFWPSFNNVVRIPRAGVLRRIDVARPLATKGDLYG
jgi:hypothetical protein